MTFFFWLLFAFTWSRSACGPAHQRRWLRMVLFCLNLAQAAGGLPNCPHQPPVHGFRPKPPCRRGGGNAKPDWVGEETLRLHAEGIGGCRKVAATFNRLYAHQGMTVGKTYVSDTILHHLYAQAASVAASKNRLPRHSPPNLRWGLDATGKEDAQGKAHTILGIVDHGSRLDVALSTIKRLTAWRVLGHLFLAIDEFGKPRAVRTDNEPVFCSAVFKTVLSLVGIRHEQTELHCPWQNGRIERFFGTLKQKLDGIEVENGTVLDGLLAQFAFWYNATRPHQHLHGLTPWEAWNGIDPYTSAPKEILRFEAWDGRLRGYYLRR